MDRRLNWRGSRLAQKWQTDNVLPNFFMSHEHNGFKEPTGDEIALCAYLIWEKEGCPEGREKEHWLQAETQLLACRAHDGWTGETGRPEAVHAVPE